ncbi:MAG: hypothetical protein Q7S52_05895 [bacterium]|nr:hypothetical protein [bacterium]
MKTTIGLIVFALVLAWVAYAVVDPLMPSAGKIIQEGVTQRQLECYERGDPDACRYLRNHERARKK